MEDVIKSTPACMFLSLVVSVLVFGLLWRAATLRQKVPGRYQNFFELALDGLRNLFLGGLGKGNERHLPFVMTLFFFIFMSNFLEFIPCLKAPTSASSIPMALGILSFFYIQCIGVKSNGLLGYVKHFAGPSIWVCWLFFPIEVMSEIAKPFSLGMRLFGNIYGEDQIVHMLNQGLGNNIILHIIPFQLIIMALQTFTNTIQAFIFPLLVCAFISSMTSHEHGGSEEKTVSNQISAAESSAATA